ncbi:MerR family transcriptional regulator [Coralliovum pocilloporae]|uniref:MerR family transcriptional regulator n=1 Tax=Coralliovum pocilloporae TaxID=3066369 RepID=UPI003307474A
MLSIGQMAKQAETKVQTIRYYEEIGLMPVPDRSEGGQRRYGTDSLDRLCFIRHARALGFAIPAIREMIDMAQKPEQSCALIDNLASRHLADVRSRIERLQSLERELERMLDHCRGGHVADCRILEVLGNHSLCLEEHDRD